MEISKPNDNGVLEKTYAEEVARHGRSYASIEFALAEDGAYRFSLTLMYSYGGFCGPIWEDADSFATLEEARNAALEELLCDFPTGEYDPASVKNELRILRQQAEVRLRQPSLF